MQAGRDNYRYLNREGKWLDFDWVGLEVSRQGALQLLSAPALADQSAARPEGGAAPTAPAGIAVDESGRVFYTVPDEDRLVGGGGCDPAQTSLSCLTEGAGLGPLSAPRGLLALRRPERLVVADSGNDRLLFFDLEEFALREVWGTAGLGAWPSQPDDPRQFHEPWGVAADGDGKNLYVLDSGNRRILKFARTGEPDDAFFKRVQQSGLLTRPGALAVSGRGEQTRVFVSDLGTNVIYVFDQSGEPLTDDDGWAVFIARPGMGNVLALAASETALYAGDNDQQRILAFVQSEGFPFAGEAAGFRGHITALAVDARGGALLVQTDGEPQPLSLTLDGAYLSSGALWSNALAGGGAPVKWSRLRASVKEANGAHVEFYYAVSNQVTQPPVDAAADDPFADPAWRALPRDVEDFLLGNEEGTYLFVGARFSSDRTGTPRLTQMRADFDAESYTRYLPAIYREPSSQAQFLTGAARDAYLKDAARTSFLSRLVSLFQGLFEDIEDEVDALERYFDAYTAPAEALPWLATWLGVEVEQGEAEARIRRSIAGAFRRYRWRGTVEGLRLSLLEEAGVRATITEPIAAASFLSLPAASECGGASSSAGPPLGLGTHLSSMEPGGAVVGSTAALDRSYLITDAQFGRPLFEGAAWQFVVEVYRSEVNTEARLQQVKEIIEREKPAHTMYRLELLGPQMSVGAQARVGVDALVAGSPGPTPLGQEAAGGGLSLGGRAALRVGTSRLGEDLKLGS